jgi:hypothetical protein
MPQRLRAYRLSLPCLDNMLVLVVDEGGDPIGWTSQAEPFDSAAALASLYRKLSRLTRGSVAISDIECLATRPSSTPAEPGVLAHRRQIRVLEGGRK